MSKAFLIEAGRIIKDSGVLLILLVAPLIYSFFYPFPYAYEIIRDIPVAVVDMDKSNLSRQITRMLDATEEMEVTTAYDSMREAENAFYERKIHAVAYIPEKFYTDVVSGKQPAVTLLSDGSYMLYYSETFASAMRVVLTASAGVKIQRMTMAGIPSEAALNLQSTAGVIQYPLYNVKGGYGTFVVPAVLCLIVQQLMLVAMMLVHGTDYEMGRTFPDNFHPVQIFFGKTAVYMIFYACISFYFYEVGMKVFHMPNFGHGVSTFLFLLPYGLSIVFLGLSLSVFAKEREGGMLFIVMTSIPLLFLSGFAWPVWEMPQLVQALRTLFPSSPGIMGFILIRQSGASLADVMPSYINLWILALVYMTTGLWAIKRRYGSPRYPSLLKNSPRKI